MVRLFNHWLQSNTIAQAVFDAVMLFLPVVVAAVGLPRGNIPNFLGVVPDAPLFALTMVARNAVVGPYDRNPGRSLAKTIAQSIIAILLAIRVDWQMILQLRDGTTPVNAGWGGCRQGRHGRREREVGTMSGARLAFARTCGGQRA